MSQMRLHNACPACFGGVIVDVFGRVDSDCAQIRTYLETVPGATTTVQLHAEQSRAEQGPAQREVIF